jgi:hypothetical protein
MRAGIVLALTAIVLVACATSYPPCYRGEYRACTCSVNTETRGYQACSVTEDGFQACVCDGTTPGVDGGRDATPDAPIADAGAPGEFLEPCGTNRACAAADAVCFDFPMKGPVCTKRCTQASDCPAPSGVCTPKQGVCKAP